MHPVARSRLWLPVCVLVAFSAMSARATTIYWSDAAQNSTNAASVGSVDANGTGATTLVSGLQNSVSLSADNDYLYYSDFPGFSGWVIKRSPITGGAGTTLFTPAARPESIFATSSYIYYTTSGGGVYRVNKDGSGQSQIVTGESGYYGVTANAANLFFSNGSNGSAGKVYKAALDGSGATAILTGLTDVRGVAASGTNLFVGALSGQIRRTDLNGGSPTLMGTAASYWQLAYADGEVFYTNNASTLGKIAFDGTGQTSLYSSGSQVLGVAAIQAVPEPAACVLALGGIACIGLVARYRRRS